MPQVTVEEAMAIALQHHQAGRLEEAEGFYRLVLAAQPNHTDALHLLGVVAAQTGRTKIALEFLSRAVAANPNVAHYHINYAHALRKDGQPGNAIAAYRQAIALNPADAELLTHLGDTLRENQELNEAQAVLETSLRIDPDSAAAHTKLGLVLADMKQYDDAIAQHRQALRLEPGFGLAQNNLGLALMGKGEFDQAIALFREAIRIKGEYEPWNNLANALSGIGAPDEAIDAYREALKVSPQSIDVLMNLALAMRETGQFHEAIATYRQALRIDPQFAPAHWGLALHLLWTGNFEEGLEEYEWRWRLKDFPSAKFNYAQPQWDGRELEGRTILLHAEQGFGDVIQFIRYAPLVAGRGGRAIVTCPPELTRLLQSVAGVTAVVSSGALPSFDVHCPMASLPRAFSTRGDSIPANLPYLKPDPDLIEHWRQKISQGAPGSKVGSTVELKVGIAWAGRTNTRFERQRMMTLSDLSPLTAVKGVTFYSLQKKEALPPQNPPTDFPLIDFTGDLRDFADTAALIANLDLVVSIDTAVAHLAGALGTAWVMLPFRADWRWLLDRDDSPWYPRMHLFRQTRAGDWSAVVARVAKALAAFVAERPHH